MSKDNNKGWIKIHRAIKDWMKDKSPSTVKVYIYLLASVNVRPKKFNWGVCGSGETFVSQNTLSKELNLSVNTIRKALAELERGGEIKRVVIDQNHIKIIVPKFDNYQFGGISKNDTPSKIDISKNDIGVYQKLTPNKNIYNKNMVVDDKIMRTHEEIVNDIFKSQITIEAFCKNEGITVEQCRRLADDVLIEWKLVGETHRTDKETKRHLLDHLRKKAQAMRLNGKLVAMNDKQLRQQPMIDFCKQLLNEGQSRDDVSAWFSYWTEDCNDNSGRMRFEAEKAWDNRTRFINFLKRKRR